jgi:hypothetical protein
VVLAEDDVPVMLEELGVPVTIAGSGQPPTMWILRQFNETDLEHEGAGELVTRGVVLTGRTGSLGQPGPNPGQTLDVNGSPMKVLHSLAIGHGILTQITCQVIDPNDWVDE